MGRRTIRYPDGAVELKCSVNDAVMRLAAYEDTGLDPEEITQLITARPGITGMLKAEYIDKAVVDKTLCDFIWELSRVNAWRESYAVSEALARVRHIPAANVRENTIRTQADRIRAMSDEELAGMLNRAGTDGRAYGPSGKAYWLNWLQSPAGGEENVH